MLEASAATFSASLAAPALNLNAVIYAKRESTSLIPAERVYSL
jgi:hypothetical protein